MAHKFADPAHLEDRWEDQVSPSIQDQPGSQSQTSAQKLKLYYKAIVVKILWYVIKTQGPVAKVQK